MNNDRFDQFNNYRHLDVSIWKGGQQYNDVVPYNPDAHYPECSFIEISPYPNPAYEGVRECLHLLGLDKQNYDTPYWNPLGEIIQPGNKVVIKPNFVLSTHLEHGDLYSIITHPSVIRAIVDYAFIALRGEGELIIADAPQMDCNFHNLLEVTRLESIQSFYREKYNFNLQIIDLRNFWVEKKKNDAVVYSEKRRDLSGDPLGHAEINLGSNSAFCGKGSEAQIYGADYNRQETISHHHGLVHDYHISKTILTADVLISVPKLKVHKKVGVTLNAKGLVGINTNKNCLVHYTLGTPANGGDQFPNKTLSKKEAFLIKTQRFLFDLLLAKKNKFLDHVYLSMRRLYQLLIKPWFGSVASQKILLDGGNWYGNDSAWRMVYDLFNLVIYADMNGTLQEIPQRKFFSIIDGIIGGENNGPLVPNSRPVGILVAGFHLLAVDIVGSRLMGFDWKKIKAISSLARSDKPEIRIMEPNQAIHIHSSELIWRDLFKDPEIANFNFEPHPGWKGYIELSENVSIKKQGIRDTKEN